MERIANKRVLIIRNNLLSRQKEKVNMRFLLAKKRLVLVYNDIKKNLEENGISFADVDF